MTAPQLRTGILLTCVKPSQSRLGILFTCVEPSKLRLVILLTCVEPSELRPGILGKLSPASSSKKGTASFQQLSATLGMHSLLDYLGLA